ncbi:MAG: glycyl-radical enzyme activating protein [Candidatus Krumholzibacteria bacterium]|nr:glycyl-radical enzyme activating protein [Candidatus Krumholzibacteria bacterium]
MTTGLIFDVKRYAIHDGPGIRTTVFFKGCPLACRWCHNPESQQAAPELVFRRNRCIACRACLDACVRGAISWSEGGPETDVSKCARCGCCAAVCWAEARQIAGRETTVEEVIAEVERDAAFYERSGGGVTFSGGEPLAQIEFLDALLRASRSRGIHTALDTCGLAPWDAIERIRHNVDLFLYDLKIMDDSKHREMTGESNERILENLRSLSRLGHEIRVRIPIIPGVNDNDDSLRAIGAFVSSLNSIPGIDILPYNRMGADKYARLNRPYGLPDIRDLSDERMAGIALMLGLFGLRVKIGG